MSRKWFAKTAAVVLTVGLLAGCGGSKEPAPNQGGTDAGNETAFRVGMVTDVGGLNDESFNASAWAGLKRAESELGYQVQAIESKRQEEYETNYQTLADQGYDLIWGIGFMMGDATSLMAEKLPDQKFALIDAVVTDRPNVASITFKEEEGSFLMGVIAARTTKTGKVGFIGGSDIEVIHHFEAGYKAGVKAANPNVEVISIYTGAFDNPSKGKSDALAVIGQGADVVFHAAGNTGTGVIEACKEKNVYAIGVDQDQNRLAPEHVISSMMKRVDVATYTISKQAQEGNFPGGQNIVLSLKDDGVGYSESTLWDKMPEGTQAEVDKWAQAIKDGKFTVPNSREALADWEVPEL